jgi:hypothetical protein
MFNGMNDRRVVLLAEARCFGGEQKFAVHLR